MADLERDVPLFDKFIPLQLIDEENESRVTTLVFRIIAGTQPAATAGQTESMFHFEITDEKDPYFLFKYEINEHNFHHLKRDQGILVEMNVFPLKLIELLELCLLNPVNAAAIKEGKFDTKNNFTSSERPSQYVAPRLPLSNGSSFENSVFSAKLNISTGVLSIVESNMFKQLTHIVLRFTEGNDESIKQYLNSRLQFTLDFARKQAKEIEILSSTTSLQSSETESMQQELQELKSQWDVDIKTLRSEHSHEMSRTQMASIEAMEEMRKKFEAQLESLRQQLENAQREGQAKVVAYDQQVAEITMERNTLEYKARDLTRSLQVTEADRDRLLQECDKAVSERRQAEEGHGKADRDIERMQSKIEALQQQVKDREESMHKTNALHKASEDARVSLEAQLQMYIANGEVLQENLRGGANEIERGNAIIAKLQTENKQLRDKVKLKSEVIRKQEAVVTDLRMESHGSNKTLSEHKDAERVANERCNALQKQLSEVQERLRESNQIIENNQQVITYLNDEMNKWQLGMRINIDSAATATATATAANNEFSSGSNRGRGGHVHSATSTTPSTTGGAYGSGFRAAAPSYSSSSALPNKVTPPSSNPANSSGSGSGSGRGNGNSTSNTGSTHVNKYGDVNHDLNNVSSSSNGSGSGSSNGSEGDDSLLLANLGLGKNVENVYMKGLKNLGLDAELSGEGVAAALRDTAAYGVFDGATGTAGGYTYGSGSAVHRAGGVSLDDLEYYKISPSTSARGASQSPPHKASRGSGSSGAAGGRKYHWQSENFGTSLESLPPQL